MLTKTNLKEQIKSFPDEFSIDELMERLLLVEKIERGIEQSKKNQVLPDAQLDEKIQKWFK